MARARAAADWGHAAIQHTGQQGGGSVSEFVRLGRYTTLLGGRQAVPRHELIAKLEISPATFKRDIAKLRDQMHVPIRFDRERGGYMLDPSKTDSALPGL